MPSNAVSLAVTSRARGDRAPADGPPPPAGRGGHRSNRTLRSTRSYVLLIGAVLLAAWLVLVFGRALTDLNEATERADGIRAESAALEARLDAGQDELALVQSDAFQQMLARGYGLGRPGERAFGLEAGAPSPPLVMPLGSSAAATEQTPLEAWLALLFGP